MTASVLGWLRARGACDAAIAWVEAQACQSPDALVAACPHGEWLLWLALRLGYDAAALAEAVRPAWLRAIREYVPAALDAAGLAEHAAALRTMPDDVDAEAAAWAAARAAEAEAETKAEAAARAAAWAAWAAAWAAEAAWAAAWAAAWEAAARAAEEAEAAARERARCADDVRHALPDLATRWAKVLA